MSLFSLRNLKEKLDAGESIEEITKEHKFYFLGDYVHIPEDIPVETLIEIVEKAPEVFTNASDIPVWAFLLLLVREKFDALDNIVSSIFKKEKSILESQIEKNGSDIANKTLSTIKQVTKEQILMLYFIMEKRKNLLSSLSKNDTTIFLIKHFLTPLKYFLSEEHFLFLFDWISKETGSYFFREVSSDFFDGVSIENQLVQENLVKYFISAHANWIVRPKPDKFDFFKQIEKVKLLNEEFFVSSVVKSYFKLHDGKKVYLLNFFLKNLASAFS